METLDVMMRAQFDPLTKELVDVTAVFPSIPATQDPHTFLSYAHIGQHGAAHRDWVRYNTKPATRSEYSPLLRELRGIYGAKPEPAHLRVVKQRTRAHDLARRDALRAVTDTGRVLDIAYGRVTK